MPTFKSRDEAIDFDLIPALRAIDVDPDSVNLAGIADSTVKSREPLTGAAVWQNHATGERLRRIAEQHRHP